jgi:DNA-binding transcriptional MocR family regulator
LLVPSFNNPLGCCVSDENKEELVRLLEKHDIPLIEDDICGDLHYAPARPKTCKSFEKRGGVLLCGSFSKTLAPGYRVGWVAPGRFREKVELLKFAHSAGTSAPAEMAIAAYLNEGGFDRHLRALRATFASQVERMAEAIGAAFPTGTRVTRPSGGFVLWVELPRRVNALELHARALRAGIGIAPGPIFSAKQRFQSFIRINCGRSWNDAIERAVGTLGSLAADMS